MIKPLVTALIITALAMSAALFFTMVQRHENTEKKVEQKNQIQPQHSIPEGSPTATLTSGNIMVSSPKANATIGNSITISGSARVFENTVNYRVLDGKRAVLAEGTTIAKAPDIGQFGTFLVTPTWSTPATISGTIEVFDYSAKDGSVIDLVTIPVGFAL